MTSTDRDTATAGDCHPPATAQIYTLGDPDRHFWLVWSVARVMGLQLGDSVASGRLPRPAYRQMINQCRRCPQVVFCESWLALSQQTSASAPPNCAIGPQLDRLRP